MYLSKCIDLSVVEHHRSDRVEVTHIGVSGVDAGLLLVIPLVVVLGIIAASRLIVGSYNNKIITINTES